jgi:serine/threonine protein kinase
VRLCINPDCSTIEWENPDTATHCENCGCGLSIDSSYTVTRLISNNSGFGTIYELEDISGQQRVLKVLHSRFNDEPRIVALFQQEVYLLQQLAAPSLPKIESYIHHELPDGRIVHGIVMEKIAGNNLLEWLNARNNRPISQSMAISWLRAHLPRYRRAALSGALCD